MEREDKNFLNGLENYKTGFSLIKTVMLVVIIACVSIVGFTVYITNETTSNIQRKVYVLSETGDIYTGSQIDSRDGRKIEYYDAAKDQFTSWYTLDITSYKTNTERALKIFGKCGQVEIDKYKRANMWEKINTENRSFRAQITADTIDMSKNPAIGVIEGIQICRQGDAEVKMKLKVSFTITDAVRRTQENPHGVIIDNWELLKFEKINEE